MSPVPANPTPSILAYDLFFKDRLCATSWARLKTARGSGGIVIDCLQRMNDVPELGLRKLHKHSLYRINPKGRPSSVMIEDSTGNRVAYDIPVEIPQGADLILESNMVPLTAYFLKLWPQFLNRPINALIPETGERIPYRLDADRKRLRSNLGEGFSLDDGGIVSGVSYGDSRFKVRRCYRPCPSWNTSSWKSRAAYSSPSGLRVKEILLTSGGRKVDATLVRPGSLRPTMAAGVFIGGSGVHSRHGFVHGIDLGYHQLLDGLAANGLASVRFERFERGARNLAEAEERLDFQTLCGQAGIWLDWLDDQTWSTSLPRVVLGHSLGGLVALALSAKRQDIACAVVINTPGRSFRKILEFQHSWLMNVLSQPARSRRESNELHKSLLSALQGEAPWQDSGLDPRLLAIKRRFRLYKSLLDLDPLELVRMGRCPLLIVQAGQDVQVEPEDADRLKDAATSAGRMVRLLKPEGLDHLLKRNAAQGLDNVRAYADRKRRIPKSLIREIAERGLQILAECGKPNI